MNSNWHLDNLPIIMSAFKENIKKELDLCNSQDTPHLCANIQTPAGYAKIETLVMHKVMNQKITISEAIVQIEGELNPNDYSQ